MLIWIISLDLWWFCAFYGCGFERIFWRIPKI